MSVLAASFVLVTLCTLLYAFIRYRLSYWQRRKVFFVPPSAPLGNYGPCFLGKKGLSETMAGIYREHRDERYVGTYFLLTPLLQLHDPEIIRQVFIKEFQDFNGRGNYCDPEADPLSGHLFMLGGQPWRNMRVKLSPTFTTGKMRSMFNTISECAGFLREHIEASMKAAGGGYEEDVRELVARFSTDVISSVAFGIESNSMKNPDSEFRRMGQAVFDPSLEVNIRTLLTFFGRDIMKAFSIRSTPGAIHDFFTRIVDEMVSYRETNKVERADMLNLLIKLKNDGFVPPDNSTDEKDKSADATPDAKQKLTMKQITAQVFVFFVAGYETTSTTTSFTLYELAKHPDIQKKLIEEVDGVMAKHNGQPTYDAIMEMPYMEMVIQETMRMYPPVPFLTREANVKRTLPLTDLTLEKGTTLMIPVIGLHHDPQYWEEPDRYNPLRFTEEAKKARPNMVYIPFGDGPRICIGMRMALVQVKIALSTILSKATVTLAPGMPSTPRMSPRTVVPTPIDGIRLTLTPRN
ncbi:cytochrome P450 6k1-like [Thrips palmi]|uniref:Cytochrome P450 6k1-like n=1 Tax=Thrips palmi TaxID=161013 RepID=A0A6P8Z6J5_THRPL|nr:cytochrome P450 6k1-like [Thrips palmi]